jgi:fumarylacetoacetase
MSPPVPPGSSGGLNPPVPPGWSGGLNPPVPPGSSGGLSPPVPPGLQSWVDVPAGSDFPIQNLPYGMVSRDGGTRRVGVAIGDHVVDLAAVADAGLLEEQLDGARAVAAAASLNPLLARGPSAWSALRARLVELLAAGADPGLRRDVEAALVPAAEAHLHLPIEVGDYVDFYSSLHHATNLGRILRPGGEPLLPNWRHLPVGYHGRAGTVVVSGTPVRRPAGQRKPSDADGPVFGPSTMLDFELEVGVVMGPGNRLGEPIPVERAESCVFGLVLVNDWSARDIQSWEYQPLGPFLGKSFATTVSPWVVPLAALEPYRVPRPRQDPPVLDYLRWDGDRNVDLELRVEVQSARMADEGIPPAEVARVNFRDMYWSFAQQIAHLTSGGTEVRPGDLYASGTVSGQGRGARGSMIELTWRGAEPIHLPDGSRRAFLGDGDTVVLRGWSGGNGRPRVGFGECRGTIIPSAGRRTPTRA